MPSVQWVGPVFTWDGGDLDGSAANPAILEFDSDNFMPDFLEAMAVTQYDAADYGLQMPEQYLDSKRKNGANLWKFYQPLHSRYYLVTGSLVCRQLGLPDKEVSLRNGESTSFVIRRIVSSASGSETEMAWLEDVGWQAVSNKQDVYPGEELMPLHPVSACTGQAGNGSVQPARRQIYFGYIPVGYRKKYTSTDSPVAVFTTESDPATAIQKFANAVKAQATTNPEPDYRLLEYQQRVANPWVDLIRADDDDLLTSEQKETASLYILLDLADFLRRALPDVWDAVDHSSASYVTGTAAFENLYTRLTRLLIRRNDTLVSLAGELNVLESYLGLVNGADINEPSQDYDLTDPHKLDADDNVVEIGEDVDELLDDFEPAGTLATLIRAALAAETLPMTYADAEETLRILEAQVPAPEATASGAAPREYRYRLRLVYDYDPDCPPLISARSRLFTLSPLLDPDAPARLVKIEMPSIKMKDMRKFSRGVGIQMSEDLRKVLSGIHKDVADDGLMTTTTFELGMICTFSLQIIMLVAFIVMFIFLIALNFIFWWLPFLRICFPIPRTSSS